MKRVVKKRTPWEGKGRQVKTVVVNEKRAATNTCNCYRIRGRHNKGDCHGT